MANNSKELENIKYEYEMLAHTTSHDLRNPLRQALIYCDILRENNIDKQSLQLIDNISLSINDAINRISKLREYSYLVSCNPEKSPIDCNKLVKEVIAELLPAIEEYNAVIKFANLPTINANEKYIKTVFKNLIDNSIKFRSEKSPFITISCEDKGDFWQFIIEDNGVGLSEIYKEIVFTVFQRLNPEIEDGSMGMGLAFCKRIIENHGGKIWYASDEENGSCFYFTISR